MASSYSREMPMDTVGCYVDLTSGIVYTISEVKVTAVWFLMVLLCIFIWVAAFRCAAGLCDLILENRTPYDTAVMA